MANNAILFNAALLGAFSGINTSRSLSSPVASDYTAQRNSALAFATLLDGEIPAGSFNQSDANLLGSIVQQVVSGAGEAAPNLTLINAIIAAFTLVQASLEPVPSSGPTLDGDNIWTGTNIFRNEFSVEAEDGSITWFFIDPITGSWEIEGNPTPFNLPLLGQGAGLPPVFEQIRASGIEAEAVTAPKLSGGILRTLTTTIPSASAATTDLSCGAHNIAANTIQAGDTFRCTLKGLFDRQGGGATPTLTVEVVWAGTVIATRVFTPAAASASYMYTFEAILRFTAVGGAASTRIQLQAVNSSGLDAVNQIGASASGGSINVGGLNTNVSNTLEFRIRMTTAVASNVLILNDAWIERLITR